MFSVLIPVAPLRDAASIFNVIKVSHARLSNASQSADVFTAPQLDSLDGFLHSKPMIIGIKNLYHLVRRANVIDEHAKVQEFIRSLEPFVFDFPK